MSSLHVSTLTIIVMGAMAYLQMIIIVIIMMYFQPLWKMADFIRSIDELPLFKGVFQWAQKKFVPILGA